jgi:hypothetical protein
MRVRATFMGRASACWAWDLASVVRKSHEHDGNANGEKNSLFRRWRWRRRGSQGDQGLEVGRQRRRFSGGPAGKRPSRFIWCGLQQERCFSSGSSPNNQAGQNPGQDARKPGDAGSREIYGVRVRVLGMGLGLQSSKADDAHVNGSRGNSPRARQSCPRARFSR